MIDRSELDIEESVSYNINEADLTFSKSDVFPLSEDETRELDLINTLLKYNNCFSKKPDLVLLDATIPLDGAFLQYCRENEIKQHKIAVHSILVSGGADPEIDPFGINGAFFFTNSKLGNELLEFIKISLDVTSASKSYVVLNKNLYKNYIQLKANYVKWLTNRDGVEVKVIGGENYVQQKTDKWDILFVDSEDGLKNIKTEVDGFANGENKQKYLNVSVPWKKIILISGPHGSGKTSIINTIISEYDFDPYTIFPDAMSDYALNYTFSTLENYSDSFLFIEDIDKLIDDGKITSSNLIKALDTCKPIDGLLVVLTCEKITNEIKNMLYRFDLVADLTKVSYEMAIDRLFAHGVTADERKAINELVKANNLTYQHITCLYEQFMKQLIKNDKISNKKQNKLATVKALIANIVQEDSTLGPSKSKKGNKIGLK